MPWAAQKPCTRPGCGVLTDGGPCPAHRRERARAYEATRDSASKRGYGRRWRKASKAFLAKYPLCAEHDRQGIVCAATEVDHIIPHKGDMKLFWDRGNWQGLCHPIHSAKTAREDGRWGRCD